MAKGKKNKGGRPTVMTPEVLGKLRTAFSFGCPDEEACAFAGIHPDSLYSFQEKNPKFAEEKHTLKLRPALATREMIVKNITKDLAHARWYATKKLPKEFGDKALGLEVGQGILILPAEIINKHEPTKEIEGKP